MIPRVACKPRSGTAPGLLMRDLCVDGESALTKLTRDSDAEPQATARRGSVAGIALDGTPTSTPRVVDDAAAIIAPQASNPLWPSPPEPMSLNNVLIGGNGALIAHLHIEPQTLAAARDNEPQTLTVQGVLRHGHDPYALPIEPQTITPQGIDRESGELIIIADPVSETP